jgi:hypothetical protein
MNSRPLKPNEIAGAISMWAMANGYTNGISVGTNQISETEIIVEASLNETPIHNVSVADMPTGAENR